MTVDNSVIPEAARPVFGRMLNGTYEPQPARRVEIPKSDGGGVRSWHPTVRTFVQQAVMKRSAEAIGIRRSPKQLWVPTASVGAYAVLKRSNTSRQGYGWVIELAWKDFRSSTS